MRMELAVRPDDAALGRGQLFAAVDGGAMARSGSVA